MLSSSEPQSLAGSSRWQVKVRDQAQQLCVTGTPSIVRVSGPSVHTSVACGVQLASAASDGQVPSLRVTDTLTSPSFFR